MEETPSNEINATITNDSACKGSSNNAETTTKIANIDCTMKKLEKDLNICRSEILENRSCWEKVDDDICAIKKDLKELESIVDWLKYTRESYLSMMRRARTMRPIIENSVINEDCVDVMLTITATRNHLTTTINQVDWAKKQLTIFLASLKKKNMELEAVDSSLRKKQVDITNSLEDAMLEYIRLLM